MKQIKGLTNTEKSRIENEIKTIGALTEQEEKQFAEFLDDLIDFTKFGGWIFWGIEKLDRKLFSGLISYLDNKYIDKAPEEIQGTINLLVKGVLANDVVAVEQSAAYLLNQVVNIPGISEEAESHFAIGLVRTLMEIIVSKIK